MNEEIKNEVSTNEEMSTNNQQEESDNNIYTDGTLNLNLSGIGNASDSDIVDEHGKHIGDDEENIPDTPSFSDGLSGEADTIDDYPNQNTTNFPNYMELFNTYKQLFENLTDDVENINKKINRITEVIDKGNKETNAAIKATQIYSKLFTKLSMGINIILIILIIILFIIK